MRKYKVEKIDKGTIFGYYTVISEGKRHNGIRTLECKCKCGTVKEIRLSSLKNGNTKSCGCYNIEQRTKKLTTHGMTGTREIQTWGGIQKRCNNKNFKRYKDYGGRGIKCEWNSFEEFYADMGERPKGMTIDRIDNDGNYCKENCKWATWREQARNKRNSRLLTYKGKTKTMVEWCEILNLKYNAVNTRINTYKWTTKKALEFKN